MNAVVNVYNPSPQEFYKGKKDQEFKVIICYIATPKSQSLWAISNLVSKEKKKVITQKSIFLSLYLTHVPLSIIK